MAIEDMGSSAERPNEKLDLRGVALNMVRLPDGPLTETQAAGVEELAERLKRVRESEGGETVTESARMLRLSITLATQNNKLTSETFSEYFYSVEELRAGLAGLLRVFLEINSRRLRRDYLILSSYDKQPKQEAVSPFEVAEAPVALALIDEGLSECQGAKLHNDDFLQPATMWSDEVMNRIVKRLPAAGQLEGDRKQKWKLIAKTRLKAYACLEKLIADHVAAEWQLGKDILNASQRS